MIDNFHSQLLGDPVHFAMWPHTTTSLGRTMAIPKNNSRLNLLHRLSADSGNETIYSSSSDFPQLPKQILLAASRGWRMFPTPGSCWIEGIGIKDATNDLTQLGQWAGDLLEFHWSLATGPESGVFALKAEEPYGINGLRGLSQLDWPETLYACSHDYMVSFWRYPAGMRAMYAGRITIAPGLTVLADGESVALPPYDSGRWPDPEATVLESPEWLSACAFKPAEPAHSPQEVRQFTLIQGGLSRRGKTSPQ
jgi:hypothetical protein